MFWFFHTCCFPSVPEPAGTSRGSDTNTDTPTHGILGSVCRLYFYLSLGSSAEVSVSELSYVNVVYVTACFLRKGEK